MPVTPEVERPIGRSASSVAVKRTDWPLRETSSRSSRLDGQAGADELVALAQVDRDEAAGAVGVVVGQARLLDQARAGGEDEVVGLRVVADGEHLGDLLARLEGEQVGHVLALAVAAEPSGSS